MESEKVEVRPLEDYITLPEAAEVLNVSKQMVHKLVYGGTFKTVRAIGEKPLYVVKKSEARQVARRRAQRKAEDQAKKLRQDDGVLVELVPVDEA